ncbi:MAG: TusE/DsrC/DsvC family sulfur relay protein [Thiobacillus sp.]|nr:TusE/DsrC/DsvC family sulfur relay protein [Thiobacillus sp.]
MRMNPNAVEDLDLLFDKDGFFTDPDQWDLALAQRLATAEGLGELDDIQQALLETLREHFEQSGAVTALSHICHLNGQEPDCLHQLFRSPRQAWRIAGLPNPGEEAKAYLA